jgi:hypothetical protein
VVSWFGAQQQRQQSPLADAAKVERRAGGVEHLERAEYAELHPLTPCDLALLCIVVVQERRPPSPDAPPPNAR